jgi:hypothetical protein
MLGSSDSRVPVLVPVPVFVDDVDDDDVMMSCCGHCWRCYVFLFAACSRYRLLVGGASGAHDITSTHQLTYSTHLTVIDWELIVFALRVFAVT